MRAARAFLSVEDSFDNSGLNFQEDDVDYISQQNLTCFDQTDNKNQSRVSWADETIPTSTTQQNQQELPHKIDDITNQILTQEFANGVFGRRTSGSHMMKKPIVENIFDEKREALTAPVIMKRLQSYLPRAVIGGPNCELHLAIGFECDLDESYWSHYSTRHDTNKYNKLRRDIETTCHNEFNGGGTFPNGGAPTPTMVFYERPPPARLGSFEIMLSISDLRGGIQHILLHTKLGSAHFPSVNNVIQRIHNIIGSKRAKYNIHGNRSKPDVSVPFSHNNRAYSKPKTYTGVRDPKTSFGFSTLPGFNQNTNNSNQNQVSETWTSFSGGIDPLKSRHNKQICELCGECNYLKIVPVADRYNHASSGKEHGFRAAYNHRTRPEQHKKSRYQVRMVGDCCLSQCVGCGWSYLDDANHEGACLPWDDAWVPEELMSQWGITRFSCRHIPQQRYRAHVPLDSRQRRRIFVDVLDLNEMNQNLVFQKYPPILELVSETTGEVIELNLSNENIYENEKSSNLLSAEIVVPDIYSLRVVCTSSSSTSTSSSSVYRSGQYQQRNWLHPFEIGYHGPLLMTCEIEFDASIVVEVRDLSGCLLDNATVNLLTPATNIFKDVDDQFNYRENMKNIGNSLLAKQMGQIYALGKAPRRMVVDLPKVYQLTTNLWGHAQVDFLKPFMLDYSSWPLFQPSISHYPLTQENASSSSPLVLSVTMVRFDITFLCTDAFGRPLPHQYQHFKHQNNNQKKKGWSLTMTEFCSNSTLPIGSYLVQDATCEDPTERTVTLSGLKYPDLSNKKKVNNESNLIDKYWSLDVESGKSFISRLKVGDREVHSGEFKLSINDWIKSNQQNQLINEHDDDTYGSHMYSQGNQSLVITIEFGAFDVLVLFRNMGFAAINKKEQSAESTRKKNHKNKFLAASSKLQLLGGGTGGKGKIKEVGQRFEAPLGTSVALVAVCPHSSGKITKSKPNKHGGDGGGGGGGDSEFVPRRVELSTSSKSPTSFTPDMLRVLRGRYQLSVSSPGFTAVGVRIAGVSIGVTNHRNSAKSMSEGGVGGSGVNEAHLSSEAGGFIDFTEDLWSNVFTNQNNDNDVDDENGSSSSSQLLIEVDLEFDPLPLLAPIQIESPCKYDFEKLNEVSVDLCFVIDATGSMGCYLQAAAHALDHAERELKLYYPNIKFRYGCVIYRDLEPNLLKSLGHKTIPPIPIEVKNFTEHVDDVEDWLLDVTAFGGGDIPEDLFSGLNHAANHMNWQADIRLCLVITDAPCHGLRFHDKNIEDAFPQEPDPHGNICEKILKNFKERQIKFVFGRINNSTDIMIKEFKRICSHQDAMEKQAAYRAQQLLVQEQSNQVTQISKLSRKKKNEIMMNQNQNSHQNKPFSSKQGGDVKNHNNTALSNNTSKQIDKDEMELERHHEQIKKDLAIISQNNKTSSSATQPSKATNYHQEDQLQRHKDVHIIDVIDLPTVDVQNYENTQLKGVELGRRLDIDEAVYEEQISYLRDLIREFLIVNSIHKELKSLVKLSWSIPAHVLYGSLNIISYELQFVPLVKPGAAPSAKTSEIVRKSLREKTNQIIESSESFIKSHHDKEEDEEEKDIESVISSTISLKKTKDKLKRFSHSDDDDDNDNDDDNEHGNKWISISLSGETSHIISIPAAIPTAFRIKAICDDGFETGYSEEQTIFPIEAEKKSFNLIKTNSKVVSIDKIIIKKSNHIDAITFVFTDGTRHNFTCLSGERPKSLSSSSSFSSAAGGGSVVSKQDKSEHQVLELIPSEHVLEVKGINSALNCEAVEFVTSHGRRARFDCEAAYQNPGTTSSFHYTAHPGRRVMGLHLRFTNTNDTGEEHHHHHHPEGEDNEEEGANVMDVSKQGFVLNGCLFDEIPYLSPEEHEAALFAASKEQARKLASLTYTTGESSIKQHKLIPNGATSGGVGEDEEEYVSGRDKAALDRKVAERNAHIANQKYREILISHAKITQQENDRIQSEKENKKIKVKQLNATIKSISTKKKIQINVINNTEQKVRICWIDYRGKEIEYYSLNHDEAKKVRTLYFDLSDSDVSLIISP